MVGPSTLRSGTSSASRTVTRQPRPAHVEATSAPMKPAPMTTTLAASTDVTAARRASESSRVRSVNKPSRCAERFGPRERPGLRPGRDDDAVALQHGAVVELDLPRLGVEPDGAAPEDLVNPVLARTLLVRQHRLLRRPGPGQYLLGERWAVVRQVTLGADKGDLPVETLRPQGLDRSPPGERRPHDENRAVPGQTLARTHAPPNIAIHSSADRGRNT